MQATILYIRTSGTRGGYTTGMGTVTSKDKSCCCSGNRGEDKFEGTAPKGSPPRSIIDTNAGRQYILLDNDITLSNPPHKKNFTTTTSTSKSRSNLNDKDTISNSVIKNGELRSQRESDENIRVDFNSNSKNSRASKSEKEQILVQESEQHSANFLDEDIDVGNSSVDKSLDLNLRQPPAIVGGWSPSPLVFHTKSLQHQTNKTNSSGHSSVDCSIEYTPHTEKGDSIISASSNTSARTWGSDGKRCIRNLTLEYSTMLKDENEQTNELTKKWLKHIDTEPSNQCHQLKQHNGSVHIVTYSSDGILICSAGSSFLHIWNAKSGEVVTKCKGHKGGTLAAEFSPGGSKLVSGGKDCLVKLWDTMNGDMIKKFRGHIGEVCSVQFASNGKYICSGSHDESIRVWETWTGECIRILDAHSDTVNCVSFSPGSDQLCSCGADGRVHLWVSSTSLI